MHTQRPIISVLGWSVSANAFVQVDAIPWSDASQDELAPDSAAPLNQTSLSIRRALLRVSAQRPDGLFGMLELEGSSTAGPAARLLLAHVGWTSDENDPLLYVRAGLMQIPFGIGVPTNARDRVFMEQPTVLRALFPGDVDAGVHAKGTYGLARWSVALMNGAPTKDSQWKGVDPSSSYDVLGRLGLEVALPRTIVIAAGVSALTGTGFDPGMPPTKDQLVWVDENQNGMVDPTEIRVIPGMPGEPSKTFKRNAIGADAQVRWCLATLGDGTATFEGVLSTNLDRGILYADPIKATRDLRELGFAIAVVQSVTPHGLVGVRYDRYDADRDANERLGVDLVGVHRVFSTWAFLVAGRRGSARLSAEYDHVQNPFGRAPDGTPTTRRDDRLTFRAQVEF